MFLISYLQWSIYNRWGGHCRGGSRGRVQGVRNPPSHEMKTSFSYWLLKFVYLTGQWRHFLEVHALLTKILDPPLHWGLQCGVNANFLVCGIPVNKSHRAVLRCYSVRCLCFWTYGVRCERKFSAVFSFDFPVRTKISFILYHHIDCLAYMTYRRFSLFQKAIQTM